MKISMQQEKFVRSNMFTIAESKFYPNAQLKGITNENKKLIGLAFYGLEPKDGNYWLLRLLIASKFQKQGYGRMAIEKIIKDVKIRYNPDYFYLCVVPQNKNAIRLYESMNFKFTGEYKDLHWTPLQKIYRICLMEN